MRANRPIRKAASAKPRAVGLSGLTLETYERSCDLESLREDYAHLNSETTLPLPFTLHEWHSAWCAHFMSSDTAIKDSLIVQVVRMASGQCVGIVPMVHTRRSVGPFAVASLNLLCADPALTEIQMPLIAAGFHAEVARLVQQHLGTIGHWDWSQWMGVTPAFIQALSGSTQVQAQPCLLDYVLDLPADWETFRKKLKRNIRESLRHCYNSLKRENLQFTFATLSEPPDIQAGLDTFLRLHELRARLGGAVTHPNHFASAESQAFLRDVCARLAARGMTRVFQLEINGQPVASRIGFVLGDTLYLYYSGYDPAWSKYSVMTTTLAEIIKFAIGQGIRTVNMSPGTDISKTRWGPREIPITRMIQVDKRLRSRVARFLYEQSMNSAATGGWAAKLFGRARRKWA
ncbi:MAG TPA: GNAT family N-acetyltransferase [Steroidobacteraceae bacterium]|nr:GNAT family N-acetyltransferase [Steroidobacteraceae bacterium]